MADGDAAAAAGLEVFPLTQDIREGYNNDNIRGDEIAAEMAARVAADDELAVGKQNNLGFTPARQGGGSNMADNTVNIGLATDGDGGIRVQVDATPFGKIRFQGNNNFPDGGSIVNGPAYNQAITGTRRALWVQNDGLYGYTPSSDALKTNIRDATIDDLDGVDPLKVLSITAKVYQYIEQVQLAADGEIDHAPTELGFLAQDLHDAGLWHCVIYDTDKDGNRIPAGVHYEVFSVMVLIALQHKAAADEKRFAAIERRVAQRKARP